MRNCQYQQAQTEGLEQQLIEVSAERDLLLEQVTADLEELSFLREIAELLTISEITWDIVDVATNVLPRLRTCTSAQQVVLLQDSEHSEAFDDRNFLMSGRIILDEEECRVLIRKLSTTNYSRPLVVNNCQDQPEYANYPELQSFVFVQLRHDQRTYGWLLVVNRDSQGQDTPGEPDDSKNLTEFGTREATLLTSVASILATHASNVELFRTKEKLFTDLVRALVRAIEAKDRYTCGHSERVALYAREIARSIALPGHICRRVYLAGLLHDVGKINISESILRNPQRLTDEEFAEMQCHPDHGWGILQGLEGLHDVLSGVVYHHERWDGRGYPDGLEGEDIPLDSRILAVADAFDAMTSDRPYRKGMPLETALAILKDGAGTQWDPHIVEALLKIMPRILEIRGNHELREPPVRKKMTIDPEGKKSPPLIVLAETQEPEIGGNTQAGVSKS